LPALNTQQRKAIIDAAAVATHHAEKDVPVVECAPVQLADAQYDAVLGACRPSLQESDAGLSSPPPAVGRLPETLFGDLHTYTVSTTLTVFLSGDIIERVIGE
jgi:hypothetical protein